MNFLKIFESRTVWVVIVLFLINGVTGIKDLIPENYLPTIDGILSLLAIFFRVKPRIEF